MEKIVIQHICILQRQDTMYPQKIRLKNIVKIKVTNNGGYGFCARYYIVLFLPAEVAHEKRTTKDRLTTFRHLYING
jgi:hypothetical protein